MRQTIFLLALASANSGVALRVVEPMLPHFASEFGTTVPAAAVVITTFAIAYGGAQLVHGPIGDRYGKLRVLAVMLGLAAVASLGCALARDIPSLAAWRFATGLFASASVLLGMAYIGDNVPLAERQPVVARFISGTIIGQALGPVIGGVFTDFIGWRATFVFLGMVFGGVASLLVLRTRAEWEPATRNGGPVISLARYKEVLRIRAVRWVLISSFVETFLFFGIFAFLGAYLRVRFDLSFTLIGVILAGFGIGGILYTTSVRWLLRKLGQPGLVIGGGALGCAAFIVIVFSPAWQIALPCTIVLGFSFYMMHNTLQTKATEMAPQARATGLSVYASAWSLGQAAGVAAMSGGLTAAGYPFMFVVFALGFGALGLWLRWNLWRLS